VKEKRATLEGHPATNKNFSESVHVKVECNGCTKMVYAGATMPSPKRRVSQVTKQVRRSVSLPPKIAEKVQTIARRRALSDNRVLVELIEQGIEAQQQKEKAFFQLAEKFREASDPEQVRQLGDQLGRFVFGE
jgi:predicted transcriptional regulator